MKHLATMNLPKALVALATLALLGACQADLGAPGGEGGLEPGMVTGAQDGDLTSELGDFTLNGDIRVATCDGPRELTSTNLVFRDRDGHGLITPATVGATDPGDLSRPYTAILQRDVEGALVTWAPRASLPTLPGPDLRYGGVQEPGQTRLLRYAFQDITSPGVDEGDTATLDLRVDDAASVVVEITTPWDDAQDDVVNLGFNLRAGGMTLWFASGDCYGEGQGCAPLPAGAQPRDVNGFIREYLYDGDGVTVIGQRVRGELLVVPGLTYTVDLRPFFRDHTVLRERATVPAEAFPACGSVVLSADNGNCDVCAMTFPPQVLRGTLSFDSPEHRATGEGPRPVAFHPTFVGGGPSPQSTGMTSSGGIITYLYPAGVEAPDPYPYRWRLEPDRYFLRNIQSAFSGLYVSYANVKLSWGAPAESAYRPPADAFGANRLGAFAWPRTGALYVPDGDGGLVPGDGPDGPYPDGELLLTEGETVEAHFHAEMAYLVGDLDFAGCGVTPNNIAHGLAELEGVGTASGGGTWLDERVDPPEERPIPTGNYAAYARGLFRAGDHADAGEFEVAASQGPWEELSYQLKLEGIDADPYDGTLRVWPADRRAFELTPGRDNQVTAEPRTLAVTRVGVILRAEGRLIRNPRLHIGDDVGSGSSFPNRVPFREALSGDLAGTYVATSTVADGVSQQDEITAVIIAMANSELELQASAEVSDDGGATWARAAFPPVAATLHGECLCVIPDGDDIEDDGEPPVASLDPVADQPLGTTAVTISGAATDVTPIVSVTVDGVEVDFTLTALGDDAGFEATFSASAAVEPGWNTVTVTFRDCVGNVTTETVTFYVAEPLCDDEDPTTPSTPAECQPDQGGMVFYVDVTHEGQPAALRCVAWPDAPPTCALVDAAAALVCES